MDDDGCEPATEGSFSFTTNSICCLLVGVAERAACDASTGPGRIKMTNQYQAATSALPTAGRRLLSLLVVSVAGAFVVLLFSPPFCANTVNGFQSIKPRVTVQRRIHSLPIVQVTQLSKPSSCIQRGPAPRTADNNVLQARRNGLPGDEDDADNKREQQQSNKDDKLTVRRRIRSWRKKIRRMALTVGFASAIWMRRPGTAMAAPAEKPMTMSLRPGISREQAQAVEEGDTTVIQQLEQAPSVFKSTSSAAPSAGGKTKAPSSAFDYYGDEDDEDDDFLDDIGNAFSVPASQSDKALAERLQSSTNENFAAYHKGKSRSLTVKVGVAFFVPTYGFMIVREYVRRRREETYVQKGLEILKAQKAEYFNVTETTADSDVEDALKDLKNKNATSTDEDDDDDDDEDDEDDEDDDDDDDDTSDDDDDDDDEPEPPRRRSPRKPLGGGPKGGAGGGSDDPGYGKPSDEDVDRLKRLYGNS